MPTNTQVKPTATQSATETQAPEPVPQETPTEIVQENGARVAFVKTRDRAAGLRQALALLGLNPVQGKQVLLKPNFNSADPTPGSTHPDVLRALVEELKKMGAGAITVADRSGMGDTRKVMEQLGVFELAKELGFDTIVLEALGAEDWIMIQPPNSHWRKGFPFARPCLEAEALVQTCCLKTHRYGGHFTLSLKNSVGMVGKQIPGDKHNYMTELHAALINQRNMIAEINTAYTPALIVLDGVQAFTDRGPDKGTLVDSEVVLAGTDRIAIDAVGVALLRYFGTTREVAKGRIFDLDQIARAVELGLGVDAPQKIELLTGDAESQAYAEQIRGVLLA